MSKAGANYRAAFAALPPAEQQARSAAWQRFESAGFPGRGIEEWHYTDLSALNDADFGAGSLDAPELPALEGWDVARFVCGTRRDAPAREPRPGLADDGVSALNAALSRDGLDWTVPHNTQAQPLQLISWCGGGMSHLRHRIRLEQGASATLLLDSRGDGHQALSTVVTEIVLEANSRLRLIRVQEAGVATTELARTEIRVGRDARLDYVGLDLGGELTRHDLNVQLAEPGASADVHGVFAPGARTHADTHTLIRHAAPHTTSREFYRGLVMDRAHAVFNGKIVVQAGAQKTDSEQHIASLLLAPGAEVNAKPELEIYADDVKCAHGATCGQLDEMAVYYLRSRGLDADTARNLLLFAFAHEVLGRISLDDARRELERRLLARLPGEVKLEELQ